MKTFFTILAFVLTILCLPTIVSELVGATEATVKIIQASLVFAGSTRTAHTKMGLLERNVNGSIRGNKWPNKSDYNLIRTYQEKLDRKQKNWGS